MTPGPLGCPAGQYTVKLVYRDGHHTHTRVRAGVARVYWTRELDAVSIAQVTIARDVTDAACDNELSRVRPWLHELELYRVGDNQPVWLGPVIRSERQRDRYLIDARDMGAWLEVRHNPDSFVYAGVDVSTIARLLVYEGLTQRGNPDPNFWPHCRFDHVGVISDREQQRTYATLIRDELDALTDQGMDYTVARRRLWCFGEATMATAATGRLTHNDILADLSLVIDGDQTATRWIVEGSNDEGRVRAIDEVDSPSYGLIERSTRAQFAQTSRACRNEAVARLRYSRNPPVMVTVPDGATLHPQAPVSMETLLPGTRWDISLVDWLDSTVTASKLVQVSVTATAEGEQVAVSFVPLGPDATTMTGV